MILKYLKIFLLFLLFCSCQNLEEKDINNIEAEFDSLMKYESIERDIRTQIPKYTVFSNYDQLANELRLKNLEQRNINLNELKNENGFNDFFIPTIIGLITLAAISSNGTNYNSTNISDDLKMDSEWIE